MKRILIFLSVIFLSGNLFSQPGEWVWLHGKSTLNPAGSFGIQGIPSPLNEPPGLYEPCEWKNPDGTFWMFGGWGVQGVGLLSSLWKYDPVTNEWTWVRGPSSYSSNGSFGTQGVSSASNDPPARGHGAASWVDNNGNFWMFGGLTSMGRFCDLWKYDPSINEWTWMNGPDTANQMGVYGVQGVPAPGNYPGGRYECAAAWTDAAGDLWLFGGIIGASGSFNDLWKYNIASNMWTWMKGSNTWNQTGSYGVKGVEAPSNVPTARETHTHWVDNAGNLWVFGGQKLPMPYFSFNDMWRFNPLTNNWTWMSGSNFGDQPASYGTQCQTSSMNTPGARFESRSVWTDPYGDFWLYGGCLLAGSDSIWSDLWKYCVTLNEWVWIEGDQVSGAPGNWGLKGVSSPLNKPNGRVGAVGWADDFGQLYLFAGGNPNWYDKYNDVWKYTIDPACGSCSTTPVALFSALNDICPGTCTDFFNLSINATSFLWYFPGANTTTSTDVNPQGICYNNPGNYDVTLIATNANGSDTVFLPNYITIYPQTLPQSIYQYGDTLVSNQGFVTYQWYLNGNLIPGATNYFYVAASVGNYNVVSTDTNNCEVEAVIYDVVADINTLPSGESSIIFPNPASDELYIRELKGSHLSEITIYGITGEKLLQSVQSPVNIKSLEHGFYIIEIRYEEKVFRSSFIRE